MTDQYVDNGVPFLRSQDIQPFKVSISDLKFISQEFHRKIRKSALGPGDVAIVRTGYPGTAAVIPPELREANCADLVIVRPGPKLDPYFVAALFNSTFGKNFVSGALVGVAQQHFNVGVAKSMEVPLPPLDTQRRIAGILSAYDDLIENNERRIAILEEMARRVFREWFVDFRFPGHEAVRMVDTEAGRIPEGWEPRLLAEVIDLDPTTKVAKDGEKPFVPMGALSTLYSYIEGVEQRSGNSGSKFKNGDTLLARITPCLENGKTALVSFLPSNNDAAFGSTEFIVMRGRRVPSSFVYCLARSEGFRAHAIKDMSGATGRQRVRNEALAQFQLMVPPLDLLTQFDGLAAAALQQVVLLARASGQLRKARDLLLPRLISGELPVSTAEPLLEAAE